MSGVWATISELLQNTVAHSYVRAALILVVGLVLARVIRKRLSAKRLHPQHQLVLRRGLSYLVIGLTISWVLRTLGVDTSLLLGAAGILTVAIGFASQTSASNLISGLFLMGEQPFVVGDIIKVSDISGFVVSIDLLSVKLRTFDNLLVRIPNETMLKANVTNLTHFPIRRVDLMISVAYKEKIETVKQVLLEVAAKNPQCLEEPRPLLMHLGYTDSALSLQFSVWAIQADFLALRSSMYEQVKIAFDRHGIEIPYPHRSIFAASDSPALPFTLVENKPLSSAENKP
jgi:small-conductance mechanosensitive channel